MIEEIEMLDPTPAEPVVWVYPDTTAKFIGEARIAEENHYVAIPEADYALLCEGRLVWGENGTLVPTFPVEKPKPKRPYDVVVSSLIREKYSQNAVEAILANYLADPENEAYKAEFEAFSAYRAECKRKAKEEIGE